MRGGTRAGPHTPWGWRGGHFFPQDAPGSLGGNRAAAWREAGLGAGDVGRQDHAKASILLRPASQCPETPNPLGDQRSASSWQLC